MVHFDNSYFEDEVRSGFFIPGMMKRAWAIQINVLKVVDEICEKYNIKYFAMFGTLLGAVRHKGMIPWDDDIDIAMLRPDYVKFISVLENELPEGYSYGNVYTDKGFTDMYTRVLNGRSFCLDEDYLKKNYQYPFIAGLDVFPFDYIADDVDASDLQLQLLDMAATISNTFDEDTIDWGPYTDYIEQLECLCAITFDRTRPIQQQALILIDQLSGIYTDNDGSMVTCMTIWKENSSYCFPKEYFQKTVRVKFEEITIPVPIAYNKILTKCFGDYQRIVKSASTHDYPFYDKYAKMLYEMIGVQLKEYKFPGIDCLRMPKENTETNLSKQRVVVFLPFMAKHWDSMEGAWKKAMEQENTVVMVVPLPYFHKGYTGCQLDYCYEKDKFPEYVDALDFNNINLEKLSPDTIIVQDCCDEYGYTLSVHPDFYTSKLARFTNDLVYIPFFLIDDFDSSEECSWINMRHYCTMPGMVYANRVILASEQLKKVYIERLCLWAGEDTRKLWDEKILLFGHTLLDIKNEVKVNKFENEGCDKKIILYTNNGSCLIENGNNAISKIKSVLEIFESHNDKIIVAWWPDELIETVSCQIVPDLWEEYQKLVEEFIKNDKGIFVPDILNKYSQQDVVNWADAFYGDSGQLAHLFMREKKPVMIQNYDI